MDAARLNELFEMSVRGSLQDAVHLALAEGGTIGACQLLHAIHVQADPATQSSLGQAFCWAVKDKIEEADLVLNA